MTFDDWIRTNPEIPRPATLESWCREAFAAGYQAGLRAPWTERHDQIDLEQLGRELLADELAEGESLEVGHVSQAFLPEVPLDD